MAKTLNKEVINLKLYEYENNGYTLFENYINPEIISLCEQTILNLLKKYSYKNFSKFADISFNSKELNNEIIKLKKSDKRKFGKIYDIVQSSLSLKKLATNPLLTDLASKFLNTSISNLMIRSTNIRLDVPEDKRNIVDWHFDTFFPSNNTHIPWGGLTIVVPFTEFSLDNGCPELCIGSHKKPPSQSIYKMEGNDSEIYKIDDSYLSEFKKVRLKASPSDLIIFPMTTVHRSGINISDQVRICALIRYYSYNHESFIPLKESYSKIV